MERLESLEEELDIAMEAILKAKRAIREIRGDRPKPASTAPLLHLVPPIGETPPEVLDQSVDASVETDKSE